MSTPGPFQQFVDDELMRAPLLAEQVIEEALQAVRRDGGAGLTPRERVLLGDVQRSLLAHRPLVVREFVRSLSEQVRHQLADEESTRSAPPSGLGGLSLVDETQVEVDVEVARAIEAIRSVAEHELRELMTYTSALVGDMDVARDYNPFRPEVMARAMLSGAQALPLKRPYQLAFLRQATPALAQLVRKAYAGACSRLESMGVEPAVYRTIIVFGSRRSAGQQDSFLDPQSNRVDSTGALPGAGGRPSAAPPAPAATPAAPDGARPTMDQVLARTDELLRGLPANSDRHSREHLRNLQAQQLAESAASKADRELVELIGRLFDTVVGDRRLETDVQNLVSRLQAPAIRIALRDPTLLDNYTHPVWLLMDRMALQGQLHPPPGDPERTRMLRFMHGLLDTLAQEQPRDADAFRWARERVMSYERVRFEQRRSAAEAELHSLQALEDQTVAGGTPPTSPGALDVGHLDTVPADLLDTLSSSDVGDGSDTDDSAWLQSRRSGEWVHMFMHGAWVHAQLIWYGRHREYWLFADGASANTWAVRRGALERMAELKLLSSLQPRSLIRDAAAHVLRKLAAAG